MSNSSRMNRQQPAKIAVHQSKTAEVRHTSVADERTALEFSEILRRHGDFEGAMDHEREVDAASERGQRREEAAPSANHTPSLFFQSGFSSVNAKADVESEKPAIVQPQTIQDQLSETAMITMPNDPKLPPAEAVVESIYREWLRVDSQPQARKWVLQLQTGDDQHSELEIEFTSSGDWQLRMGSDEQTESSKHQLNEMRLAATVDVDIKQFCNEIEARLRISQPGLRFSAQAIS